ncbi:SDR family NAD(P)-dependent oxidoreductase [Labilibaculum sp.]|uniref:SDR family NAD(P)-dependent oxidoreductase n=1 Tax=Labilibaculum sp. TaxID=2060723 RepID=UPI00356A65F9
MRNKTALITGAAKRIGKSIAMHMAKNGFDIAIHYNSSKNDAIALQAFLMETYPDQKFKIFKCNLSRINDVETCMDKVLLHFEKIDVLVNNASVFDSGVIQETSVELLQNQMNVNLMAPFILCRDYAMNSQIGVIINLLDTRITTYSSSHAAYSLSKVAFAHLTKMSALEFSPAIRVNGIAPGATLPPENRGQSYLNKMAERTPMKEAGGILPILQSLDYILDNQNLTGQILFCDGGEQLL